MRRLTLAVLGFAFFGFSVLPVARADSLQDVIFNVNGNSTEGSFAMPGLDSSGFNTTTGEGSLTFTFDPGVAGSYFFNAWFDNELSVPFDNEYGVVSGSPASGQSWEIGDPNAYYAYLGPLPAPPGTDPQDDTYNNTLTNTNYIPGTTSNYFNDCTADCNGDVSMAMGFAFTLDANQQEVITLDLSETNPGSGFYLEQVHPVDPNNLTETDLYFTGSAETESTIPPPSVPEPSTLLLLEISLAAVLIWRGFQTRSWLKKVLERA
jgi:hypothetical protein